MPPTVKPKTAPADRTVCANLIRKGGYALLRIELISPPLDTFDACEVIYWAPGEVRMRAEIWPDETVDVTRGW